MHAQVRRQVAEGKRENGSAVCGIVSEAGGTRWEEQKELTQSRNAQQMGPK